MKTTKHTILEQLALCMLSDNWESFEIWGNLSLKLSAALGDMRSKHPDLLESRSGHYGSNGRWVRQWRRKIIHRPRNLTSIGLNMKRVLIGIGMFVGFGVGIAAAHTGNWDRGERFDVPQSAWNVVSDWNLYAELDSPPEGCEWVRSGSQYLLLEISTGYIRSVIGG